MVKGHDCQHMCMPCRHWTINNHSELAHSAITESPSSEVEYRDKHRVHTKDTCWACQVGTGQPPGKCKRMSTLDTEAITWVLPCRNSRAHVQSQLRGPLCTRAACEGLLYRSSGTLCAAIAWGKKLCTFCYDRLPSTTKHQLAVTGGSFVPSARLITAALAQQFSLVQGACHDRAR